MTARRIPSLLGADVELANFFTIDPELPTRRDPAGAPDWTARTASRELLRQIDGIPGPDSWDPEASPRRDHRPEDWGRKFLPANGGCCYIDLDHLEVCLPEHRSAFDHVALWHASLRLVRQAQSRANLLYPETHRLRVLVNNSDGHGHSYGAHINFLISRRLWNDLFLRRMHRLAILAAHQVTSLIYTGQGKVGSENGAPHVDFQISQRADFFEQVTGEQTTYRRPIVNSRDEPLAGPNSTAGARPGDVYARLHVIFFDATLSHVSTLLKAGTMQIVLAMLAEGRLDSSLELDDPISAVRAISHDPTLGATVRTASARRTTALQLQFEILEAAERFVARGGCDGIVPRAREIVDHWKTTLELLEARDWDALFLRLDWVQKYRTIERWIAAHPGSDWSDPAAKHLDLLYSSLDPAEGLYWKYEPGLDLVVEPEEIERYEFNPPADTRAWGRAMFLRRGGRRIRHVDWDSIEVDCYAGWRAWKRSLALHDPFGHTRSAVEGRFRRAASLEELMDLLEAPRPRARENLHNAS